MIQFHQNIHKEIIVPKLNSIKELLFSDPATQTALVEAIRDNGYSAENAEQAYTCLIHEVKELELQTILAPFLRALAIEHIREGSTTYVTEFRELYDDVVGNVDTHEAGDAVNITTFLNQQSQNGIYATDIEAGALAEKLGVTFAWTQVNADNFPSQPTCIGYHSSQEDAAIIHLYNRPGDHFFVVAGEYKSTLGDGNCLYNGFAQIIRQLILTEELAEVETYVNQAEIYRKIKNIPSIPLNKLITDVRMQHKKQADKLALAAAVLIAKEEETSINIENMNHWSEQEKKLLQLIRLIGEQVNTLNSHNHSAKELASTLAEKATAFCNLPSHKKRVKFTSFQKECLDELATAKNWPNHCDYKQIFFNILQTLTVIGAVLGLAQWCITGRYSLYSTPTTSLFNAMDKIEPTLNELASQFQSH